MDKCAICFKPAGQLFETGKDGVYACFKCQPLVPEITIGDHTSEVTEPRPSNNEELKELNETGLSCGICHKTFQKSMQLHNHLRNHRAERRFVCTYCNKAFSQSNNLRAHLRIHTNERPYKCSECGKAFTQVTNLNNHVRLHTGERPYVCPEPGCDKAYAQVTNLNNHVRLHTGERPHVCPETGCDKSYPQVTNLNQHRKRHLTGRPVENTYDCTVCGEKFQQRNHMYSHRRTVHADMRSPVRSAPRHACGVCGIVLPSEAALRSHSTCHLDNGTQEDDKQEFMCVFSSCGERFSSPREHTEHLLRAHQLRVLAARAHAHPPRRGRPPKNLKDPLDLKDTVFDEVKIIKQEPQYLPKLKVQSLFQ